MGREYTLQIIVVCFLSLILLTEGSVGDSSTGFRSCSRNCFIANCTTKKAKEKFLSEQPLSLWLTLWSCEDECKYWCMWETVAAFTKAGNQVPQFHGKWPFVRVLGMQEPASVLFSVLNFMSFMYMLVTILRKVPPEAPMFRVWVAYALVGLFTWTWSGIFHSRDFGFTERMDYFCAFASVLFGFFISLLRIFGPGSTVVSATLAAPFLAYYCYHVNYLSKVKFDYSYNMKASVAAGVLNSVTWLLFCGFQWFKGRGGQVWPCALVVVWAISALSLELWDFSPIFWIFDAHSLWHLCTAPLGLLWTKFTVRDCEYMVKARNAMKKIV